MPKILKLIIPKINREPTVQELKAFGIKYNKEEWAKLCGNSLFMHFIDKDLNKASKIAEKLLNKV
jgi:hypothetical protein